MALQRVSRFVLEVHQDPRHLFMTTGARVDSKVTIYRLSIPEVYKTWTATERLSFDITIFVIDPQPLVRLRLINLVEPRQLKRCERGTR